MSPLIPRLAVAAALLTPLVAGQVVVVTFTSRLSMMCPASSGGSP